MTLEERWLSRIAVQDDGCWIWTGGRWARYGKFYVGGDKRVAAHRWGYEHFVALIEEGLELDHLCRNIWCVNYAHLEPVTHGENVRRGMAGSVNGDRLRSMTHCEAGHEFNESNTRYWKGRRLCRACDAERARRYRSRKTNDDHPAPSQRGGSPG